MLENTRADNEFLASIKDIARSLKKNDKEVKIPKSILMNFCKSFHGDSYERCESLINFIKNYEV